ncbi:potassium channel family protein [Streptomyces calidiresistens]|uniref:ion transporter n=1 Tax=Streptomyces calidiresistens TaxID=1485586 RepID=UPI0015FAF0B3|nr:ion transporter [Streptomyces calidiresistens]
MTTRPSRLFPASAAERERFAEQLLDRLTPLMSALGLLFLFVVIGERLARPGGPVATALALLGWLLWGVFVAEFLVRVVAAPRRLRFLRRNWWQVVFLVLPFLRILRLVRSFRVLRGGRVLSSTVRSSRSAGRVLGNRISWLAVVTAIVVLGSSELLHGFAVYPTFGDALHATAMAAVSGAPLGREDAWARVVEVALAMYSVGVFATLAATVGAYFVDARPRPVAPTAPSGEEETAASDRG